MILDLFISMTLYFKCVPLALICSSLLVLLPILNESVIQSIGFRHMLVTIVLVYFLPNSFYHLPFSADILYTLRTSENESNLDN